MIPDFDVWSGPFFDIGETEELRGTRIGIDAPEYVRTRIQQHAAELLLPATGGLPFGLKHTIEADLQYFKERQIDLVFVFPGIDLAKPEDPFRHRQEAVRVNAEAWRLYDSHDATSSVQEFGKSKYVLPEDLARGLQQVLFQNDVKFIVAPYSQWAQLAYFEQHKFVAAVAGSSELVLFPCAQPIIEWEFDHHRLRFIKRNKLFMNLQSAMPADLQLTEDLFIDICLLAGNHFLPTFPPIAMHATKIKPLRALDLVLSRGGSGWSAVQSFADDPRVKESKYVDRYRRARLAVKHHIVMDQNGGLLPTDEGHLPNDPHEFFGQRLPEEIYFYLSRGLIDPRLLQWRTSSEIIEPVPVDGGDSNAYKTLVSSKLNPLRETTLKLLSSALHYWYQNTDITLKCWFPETPTLSNRATLSMKGAGDLRRVVEMWNVKAKTYNKFVSQYEGYGLLGRAVLALKDDEFVKTSSSKKSIENPLSSSEELQYNTLWRFLTLRDYVDLNHNLTAWGKILATVIKAVEGDPELEEAAVLAVELLRLEMLNGDASMFPTYKGAPFRGDDKQNSYMLLISRVAGLATLTHKPLGYTGPLSRHLLGYNSVVNAVRSSLRDLVEVSATQLCLSGCADRKIPTKTIVETAMDLPFLLPINCALSIAMKSYVDELCQQADPESEAAKATVLEVAQTRYFPQTEHLAKDLKRAFRLWDAVFEGVSQTGNLIRGKDQDFWTEAYNWMRNRH